MRIVVRNKPKIIVRERMIPLGLILEAVDEQDK